MQHLTQDVQMSYMSLPVAFRWVPHEYTHIIHAIIAMARSGYPVRLPWVVSPPKRLQLPVKSTAPSKFLDLFVTLQYSLGLCNQPSDVLIGARDLAYLA